jgi:hypothetical protein
MTFAQPSILVALAALAIPLAIHSLGRRRARRVILPTARFAEGAHQEARGRLWLKKLTLLGLRLAAVAFLVLALAGPQIARGTPEPAVSPAAPAPKEAPPSPPAPPTADAVRILVVDAADETGARLRSADLVAAAFAGESGGQKIAARRRAAQVDRAALDAADVVFWVGPQAPPAAGLLEAFLARGALVWIPADSRPPESGLAQPLALKAGEAQSNPDGFTIDPAGYVSDLLGAFEGGTSGDLGAPVFRRRLALDGAGASAISFRDGRPAIVDRRFGQGRGIALAAGPGPEWGDLAGRAEFVVLMHSLAEALAPVQGGPGNAPAPSTAWHGPAPSLDPVSADSLAHGHPTAPAHATPPSHIDLSSWFILALAVALAAEGFVAALQCSARKLSS